MDNGTESERLQKRPDDAGWPASLLCVVILFGTVTGVYGVPTGEGGIRGDMLVLAGYVGQTIALLLAGAVATVILWMLSKVRSRPYRTPRRDLLLVALAGLFLMLLGSGAIDRGVLTALIVAVGMPYLFLAYGNRFSLPARNAVLMGTLGLGVVAVPMAMIAASFWLIDINFFGGAVLFVSGAALFLFLLLRRERHHA